MSAPQTGEKFKDRPYYGTWWFEWAMLALSGGMAWLLWNLVDQHWALNAGISNQFVELATNLTTGKGYVLMEQGQAIPYLENPPLYPFLLSLLMQATQTTNIQQLTEPLMTANLILYLGSVMLVFQLLNQRIKKLYSFLVTFIYASSPFTLSAAESLSPELLFLVFTLLAVGAIDKTFMKLDKHKKLPVFQAAICILWIVAAMLTKNLGIALMLAYFLLLLNKRTLQSAFVTLGIILLLMSPWYFNDIAQRNFSDRVAEHVTQTKSSAYDLASPFKDPDLFLDQLLFNADASLAQTTEATLGTLDFHYLVTPVAKDTGLTSVKMSLTDYPWIRWAVGSFMVIGILFAMYQYAGIAGLYLLTFMILNLFFPLDGRLSLFPVYPLMLFGLFNGVLWLGRGFSKVGLPFSKVAVPVLAGLILFNSLNQHFNTLTARKNGDISQPEEVFDARGIETVNPVLATAESGYIKAMNWIKQNTQRQATVSADNPEDIVLFSQRRSQPIKSASPEKLAQQLASQSDYIVQNQSSPSGNNIQSAVQQQPGTFKLVYQDLKNKIKIWKVNKDVPQP